jgi:hypothetical protein
MICTVSHGGANKAQKHDAGDFVSLNQREKEREREREREREKERYRPR